MSAPGRVVPSGPTEGETADVLVMESTYGNRQHPTSDPRPELASLIRRTVERGGSVIVPAFAVERTQKFLFMLKELMQSGQLPAIPVYCDSPMAIKAVEIFMKHTEEYSEDTRRLIGQHGSPLDWPGFTFASTADESKKINGVRTPSIIVSSSGMVTGGRILHHLAQRLPDPRNTVIFIGFQAPGTRGFTIKSGAPEVKIFGDIVPIRAQVAALEQFSDHADTPELLQWLRTFPRKPPVTYLVHGEPAASIAVARYHDQRNGMECPGGAVDAESGDQLVIGQLGNLCNWTSYYSLGYPIVDSQLEVPMTEAELKKHLDAAEKSPKQIAAAVSGLPDKTLRYKPSPDKWCILEVLGHLADIEIVYAHRFRQMLADKKPVIAPMDQDAWAQNLGYLETPAPELIALYGLNRHHTLQLLRRLKSGDLEKSAYHPELKHDVTVAEYVEKMGTHGANHLAQIERLKKEAALG